MTKTLFLFLALCASPLTACKKDQGTNVPPPIATGKCLADTYQGARAMTQTCIYVGYSWGCHWNAERYDCKRGAETSAVSERAPVPITGAGTGSSGEIPAIPETAK